jgi:hypothetical protein
MSDKSDLKKNLVLTENRQIQVFNQINKISKLYFTELILTYPIKIFNFFLINKLSGVHLNFSSRLALKGRL